MNFKKWIYYRFMRTVVRIYSSMNSIDNRKSNLDEIQKPIFELCLKLINERSTELRNMRGEYQLENKDYFVSIRYNSTTPIISFIESRDQCSNIHMIFMDNNYVESIIDTFDREMSRRMRYKEAIQKKEISSHLNKIVDRFNQKVTA